MEKLSTKLNYFNLSSWFLIVLASLLLFLNPGLIPPNFSDISYHLSVAHSFNQAGGLTLWDFWEAAPTGRAYIYPPFFHIFLLFLLKLGLKPFLIIKLVSFLIYPFTLIVIWYTIKNLFNPLIAFLTTLFTASSFYFIVISNTAIPGTIVVALTPLLILFFKRKKYLGCIFLLILIWYTHMILPYFSAFAFLCYGLVNRKDLKKIVLILLISYLAFLPWLIQISHNLNYIKYLSTKAPIELGKSDAVFDLLLPFCFIIALIIMIIWWPKEKLVHQSFPFIGWALSMAVLIPYYPERFFDNGGLVAMAVVVAVFFVILWAKLKNQKARSLIIGLIILLACLKILSFQTPQPNIQIYPPSFITLLNRVIFPQTVKEYDPYSQPNLKLADLIIKNSQPNEIIWSTTSVFEHFYYTPEAQYIIANFFGSLTGRAVANARLPEFFQPELWQPLPIEKAKIVIAEPKQTPFWQEHRAPEQKKLSQVLENDFELIGQTEILYLYKNKNPETTKTKPVQPILPTWLGIGILFVVVLIIVWPLKRLQ